MPNKENNNGNLEKESHDDSIILFMENEELRNESDDDVKIDVNKDNVVNSNNKSGRKTLFGGPSEETFFSLAHTLRWYKDYIIYMLNEKKLNMS